MTLLSNEQIETQLTALTAWTRSGDALEMERDFPSFKEAIAFVNRVADVADEEEHHPDIYNHWRTVRLVLTTHDAGGLTEWDFDLAKRIQTLL